MTLNNNLKNIPIVTYTKEQLTYIIRTKMSKSNLNKKHAKLSASGADKWINCPGSVAAESKFKNVTSGYAEEGTLAHEIADRCLKSKKDAYIYIGKTLQELKIKLSTIKPTQKIEEDMTDFVQEYIDYVRAHETTNTQLYTEEQVDFSNVVPEGFGTMDSAVLDYDTKICHIFDLKYGKGVAVYADNNYQGMMYAIGLYNELSFLGEIKSFRIHICQPRKQSFSSWDISVEDLVEWSKYVKERAELALSPNAPRIPGKKQCLWCRAKGSCAAATKEIEEILDVEFEDFDMPESQDISMEKRVLILENISRIEAFLKAVKDDSYLMLMDGKEVPTQKLVESRTKRVLIDGAEEIIVEKLGEEESYNKKIIGLGQLEKKLSKKEVEKLTVKPKGKLVMVHESDNREPASPKGIAGEFEDMEIDEDL